jgi:hypothetical protein
MSALGRFVFWDFPRGVWQYDVMVGLILAFIFLTPREVFRDQPKPASVVMLPEQGGGAFLIETRLLEGVAPQDRAATATRLVNARYKTRTTVVRVEPIMDAEDDVIGYTAYTHP